MRNPSSLSVLVIRLIFCALYVWLVWDALYTGDLTQLATAAILGYLLGRDGEAFGG